LTVARLAAILTGHAHYGGRVNKKDLKRFKDLLLRDRELLLKKAAKLSAEDTRLDTDDLPDEIDQASSEYLQSFSLRLRDREKFFLQKIDKALAKIEAGEFGICEVCGEEISVKRLEARPVTTLCIRCKEEQEKQEKSYT
jgi:DnaK suppressor protein